MKGDSTAAREPMLGKGGAVAAILTATACLEMDGRTDAAFEVGMLEAGLRRLGAKKPRAWVDRRRDRLEATFDIEDADVFLARIKLDDLLEQLAGVMDRPV